MTAPLADDFAYIRARIAELEAEKKPAEEPKAWPSYAAAEQSDVAWGHYTAPDYDPA